MRRPHRRGRYVELVEDAKAFLAGKSTGVQARLGQGDGRGGGRAGFRVGRGLSRPAARADLYPGQPDRACRRPGRRRHLRLGLQGRGDAIQAFFIRGGQNWGHRAFFPAHTNDVPEAEVLSSFLVQFYEDMPPPRRILVDRDLPDRELMEEALCERSGHKVVDRPAQRGARAKLIEQARATPRKRSSGGWPRPAARPRCCASSPTPSSCPTCPSASRSTTTATSWAPARPAR